MPMLIKGEVVVHIKTKIVGEVLETFQMRRDKVAGHEQMLRLKDGSHRSFPVEELRLADHFQVREFFRSAN